MCPNLNKLCHRALPMQQQHPVKNFFDEEPFIHQTMTKLLKTIM
jgi:hypothetical protein